MSGGGEVGPGVAGLEVGGGARAVDEQGEEQQRRVVQDGGDDDAGRADRPGEVPRRESGAAAAGLGDAADGDGGGPFAPQRAW